MTNSSWQRLLLLFDENERVITGMKPSEPAPSAKFCGDSAHRTLGHLTACQSAWLPLMSALRSGESKGSIPINPDPLFRKLGYETLSWNSLVERFVADRAEWRELLQEIDLSLEIQTPRRVWSPQTLIKRMVEHEKNHLNAHPEAKSAREKCAQNGKNRL